jgi:tetratricopeptide (TPR) repeat protein
VLELESLEAHVALHLAQTERQIGLCYPAGTADRDDALLQATKRLTVLAQRSPPNELVWNARVELVACQRELGNPQTAQRLIDAWTRENPPAAVVARFEAETEQNIARPIDMEVDSPAERPSPPAGSAALVEAAAARSAGDFKSAAEQYREFAMATPHDPQAAEAHRISILCVTDHLREISPADRAKAIENYEKLLREHLQQWPSRPSADDVRIWLARLLATRNDWAGAVSAAQEVRSTSDNLAASLQLIGDTYNRQMQLLPRTDPGGTERAKLLADVTQRLQPAITGAENRWPNPWSDLQRDVALQLEKLHVRYGEASSPYAAQLLTASTREKAAAEDSKRGEAWNADARAWLAAALARNGELSTAKRLAEQNQNAPPEVVLDALQVVVDDLPAIDAVTDDSDRQRAEVALAMVRSVDGQSSTLDDAALARLNAGRAAALAAMGDRNAALTQYGALAGQSPDNGDIQARYAALLAATDDPKELRQSLALWQTVESRSGRGTDRWQRARRARIALLTRLGETEEAEKLLNLTRLLYPNWESATLQQQK